MTGPMFPAAQPPTLPRRPRLLPGLDVVERRAHEIQIGLDPRHAVVATDLPPILVDILRGLDGRRSTSSLFSLVDGAEADRLGAVLSGLVERGLVEDAAESPSAGHGRPGEAALWSVGADRIDPHTAARRSQWVVEIHGGGRLAAATITVLASAGIGSFRVSAQGRVGKGDLGSGFLEDDVGTDRHDALTAVARRANPEIRVRRAHNGRASDLVLLTDAVVPAPEVVENLMAAGLPHLTVRVRDGIGIVGPFVVPGRTSCLRCADLHRAGLDSCWPRVAGQLAGRYQKADLASVSGTAALAAGQVLRALSSSPSPPPTWNATLELDCFEGTVNRRGWLPHPHCSCGARVPR